MKMREYNTLVFGSVKPFSCLDSGQKLKGVLRLRGMHKMLVLFGLLSIPILFGAGCKKDIWRGFYYPSAFNLAKDVRSGELTSLDQCRVWINGQRMRSGIHDGDDDYECGKNCRYDSSLDMYICEETIK